MTDIVSKLLEFNPKGVTPSDLSVRKGSPMTIMRVDWRGQRLKAGLTGASDNQWEMAVGTLIDKRQTMYVSTILT